MRFAPLAGCVLALTFAGAALSQTYPNRTVRIITGYASGGMGSAVSRHFADALATRLKQPVVVEDRPGASNAIGARAAMAAPADGYTLHIGGINPHPLLQKNGVNLSREMEPVGIVAMVPLAFITTAAAPLKSVADVVAYAKANPGRLNFASSGGGAHLHLMMALFASRAGNFSYEHIPFKGTSEIQMAIIRGDVQITLLSAPSALPLLNSGKAHAVLIGAPTRSPLLPNVPTPAEAGLKPFTVDSLLALWAPRGTPREVIRTLSTAALAVVRDPAYIEDTKTKTGGIPVALTPEQTRARFAEMIGELEEAILIAKYKPE